MGWISSFLLAGGILATACLLFGMIWKPLRIHLQAKKTRNAIRVFPFQREQLEAKFFDLACSLGKPRGLRWVDCEWENSVTFARDMNTGLLTAFVAVNIRFEAIEGGDMEDVEAVSTVRDAAALFHFQHGIWGTGGRALMNMNPEDALLRLRGQFEPVSVPMTSAPAS